MRRVLVIRFSSLGDILLTFPSLNFLASQGVEIHYLTKESFRPLVELAASSHSVHIHTISNHAHFSELLKKARELRNLGFDEVYDLHRNLRSRIVSYILRRPTRRVWKFRFKEFFLYLFRRGTFGVLGLRSISRPGESLRVVGGDGASWELFGRAPTLEKARLVSLGGESNRWEPQLTQRFSRGYVCVAAESAWKQKEWPVGRFIDVAKRISAAGFGVVWIGLRSLPDAARFEGAVDLTGKLAIADVAQVLAGARGLVCNDSGLMHLSEAVGTPVAAIFGPTSRELGFAPRLSESRIVETKLWCRPCSKTGRLCIRPIARRKCLSDVSVEATWGQVQALLNESGARS